MRPLLTRLHRWAGLFLALFLTVAGLTGAVIAWEQPLDRWLNPTLFLAPEAADRPVLAPLELARRLEAAEPHLQVIELPLAPVPGRTLVVTVAPRVDAATGVPPVLGFDQVMLDPATGAVRGSRDSFASTLSRETLLPSSTSCTTACTCRTWAVCALACGCWDWCRWCGFSTARWRWRSRFPIGAVGASRSLFASDKAGPN